MANGTTDLSLTKVGNPPAKNADEHFDGDFEADTLGDTVPKSVEEVEAEEKHDKPTDEIDPAYRELKVTPLSTFLDHAQYNVTAQTIVNRRRHVIYQNNTENLVERQDTRYLGFDWVHQLGWTNETNTENNYSKTVEEGLTITDGQETERNFGVSASFRGLGVEAGGSRKVFTSRETSVLTTTTKVIPIPPQSTINFYQKRYNFLVEVWFWQRVPNWQNYNHFTIGADRTYARVQRTAKVSIFAEEYATLHRRLSGSATITAVGAPSLSDDPFWIRQFTNITAQAKRTLRTFGITG